MMFLRDKGISGMLKMILRVKLQVRCCLSLVGCILLSKMTNFSLNFGAEVPNFYFFWSVRLEAKGKHQDSFNLELCHV